MTKQLKGVFVRKKLFSGLISSREFHQDHPHNESLLALSSIRNECGALVPQSNAGGMTRNTRIPITHAPETGDRKIESIYGAGF